MSHRLYMDDLKLYAPTEQDMVTLVNTTAEFSSDIKMEFGLDKCATIKITKGGKCCSSQVCNKIRVGVQIKNFKLLPKILFATLIFWQ